MGKTAYKRVWFIKACEKLDFDTKCKQTKWKKTKGSTGNLYTEAVKLHSVVAEICYKVWQQQKKWLKQMCTKLLKSQKSRITLIEWGGWQTNSFEV